MITIYDLIRFSVLSSSTIKTDCAPLSPLYGSRCKIKQKQLYHFQPSIHNCILCNFKNGSKKAWGSLVGCNLLLSPFPFFSLHYFLLNKKLLSPTEMESDLSPILHAYLHNFFISSVSPFHTNHKMPYVV